MESRVQDAVMLFESGFNCAQSVFAAYADLFGMDRETALKLACPMGAGVGRMREVCGTVSAMAMLSGLKWGIRILPMKKPKRVPMKSSGK